MQKHIDPSGVLPHGPSLSASGAQHHGGGGGGGGGRGNPKQETKTYDNQISVSTNFYGLK